MKNVEVSRLALPCKETKAPSVRHPCLHKMVTYLGQINTLLELGRELGLLDQLLVFVLESDVLVDLGSSEKGSTHFNL
jgi:hypothetical protein